MTSRQKTAPSKPFDVIFNGLALLDRHHGGDDGASPWPSPHPSARALHHARPRLRHEPHPRARQRPRGHPDHRARDRRLHRGQRRGHRQRAPGGTPSPRRVGGGHRRQAACRVDQARQGHGNVPGDVEHRGRAQRPGGDLLRGAAKGRGGGARADLGDGRGGALGAGPKRQPSEHHVLGQVQGDGAQEGPAVDHAVRRRAQRRRVNRGGPQGDRRPAPDAVRRVHAVVGSARARDLPHRQGTRRQVRGREDQAGYPRLVRGGFHRRLHRQAGAQGVQRVQGRDEEDGQEEEEDGGVGWARGNAGSLA